MAGVELVADRPELDVVAVLGPRALYQLYDNKLDCFLDALDLVGEVLLDQLRAAPSIRADRRRLGR